MSNERKREEGIDNIFAERAKRRVEVEVMIRRYRNRWLRGDKYTSKEKVDWGESRSPRVKEGLR